MVVAAREPATHRQQRLAVLLGARSAAAAHLPGPSITQGQVWCCLEAQAAARHNGATAAGRLAASDTAGSDGRRETDQHGQAQLGPRAAAGAAGAGTHGRRGSGAPAARPSRTVRTGTQPRQESGRRPAGAPWSCRRAGVAGWPATGPGGAAPPGAPMVVTSRHGAARRSGCDWAMQIGRGRCLPHGRGPAASWARAEGRAGGRRRPHNPPGRPPGAWQG